VLALFGSGRGQRGVLSTGASWNALGVLSLIRAIAIEDTTYEVREESKIEVQAP
jgi:hypothetical protein